MGWLSWERFGCYLDCDKHPDTCISETLYLQQAQQLVIGGYRDAGYVYVNIDDCWSEKQRDNVTGQLVPDRVRFPRGMKHLSHQLHRIGLKLGLYGDIGSLTCAGYPGFDGHWEQDAQQLADWEIDSIKVDGCHSDQTTFNVTYPAFGRALNKTGRPMLYNCQWPLYQTQSHHGEDPDLLSTQIAQTCNQWRNYYDVFDSWVSIRSIVDYWSRTNAHDVLVKAAGPGHWNDPDMLVVGNPGLSLSEQQAQFALWAIFAAPLLLSADLRTMPLASRRILLNSQVIAVNQDPLGRQGYCPQGCNPPSPHRIYVRELSPEQTSNASLYGGRVGSSNRWAVVLANFDAIFATVPLTFDPVKHLPSTTNPNAWMNGGYIVQDILEHRNCGMQYGPFSADVDESSVRMFVVVAQETAIGQDKSQTLTVSE